jgi:hypothetical protein
MRYFPIAMTFALLVAGGAGAQDQKVPFEPTKEHQLLKQFDGEWDYKASCTMPGKQAMEGTGVETVRYGFGGYWLTIEDRGSMMNKEFTGTGLVGYDPLTRKYVAVWADSMTPFLGRAEGTAESDGKRFTFTFAKEMKKSDMPSPERMVFEFKDPDHRTLRFYGKDDSGKESLWSTMTFTRKAGGVK